MSIFEALERNRAVYLAMTQGGVQAAAPAPSLSSPFAGEARMAANRASVAAPSDLPAPPPLQAEGEGASADGEPDSPAAFSLSRPRILTAAAVVPPAGSEPVRRAEQEADPLAALEERIETRSRLGSQLLSEEEY